MPNMRKIALTAAGAAIIGGMVFWIANRDEFAAAEAMFERGEYVSAYHVYLDLAKQGDVRAQYAVSRILEQGLGPNIYDVDQSNLWLQRSAAGGYAYAQLALGDLFSDGMWIEPDPVQAEEWWGRAADQGLHEAWPRLYALYGLSESLDFALESRQPAEDDILRLEEWAAAGHLFAKVMAAKLIESGAGESPDPGLSMALVDEAAAAGSAEAVMLVAAEKVYASPRMELNEAETAALIRAANSGHGPAAAVLADVLQDVDPGERLYWSYIARKSSDPRAAVSDEQLAERSASVPADEARAIRDRANGWLPEGRPVMVRAGSSLFR